MGRGLEKEGLAGAGAVVGAFPSCALTVLTPEARGPEHLHSDRIEYTRVYCTECTARS